MYFLVVECPSGSFGPDCSKVFLQIFHFSSLLVDISMVSCPSLLYKAYSTFSWLFYVIVCHIIFLLSFDLILIFILLYFILFCFISFWLHVKNGASSCSLLEIYTCSHTWSTTLNAWNTHTYRIFQPISTNGEQDTPLIFCDFRTRTSNPRGRSHLHWFSLAP